MPKLLKHISEYFLGTETRKFHKAERNFYREFLIYSDVGELSRKSEICQRVDLVLGRLVPNIFSSGALAYFLITRNPSPFLLLGGGLRFLNACFGSVIKKRKKNLRKIIMSGWAEAQHYSKVFSELEDSTGVIDEGEAWKNQ